MRAIGNQAALAATVFIAIGAGAGDAAGAAASTTDSSTFALWNRVGDITLGEPRSHVEAEYGSEGSGFHVVQRHGNAIQGFYRLHGSQVTVTFYGSTVGEIEFATPYYRTSGGFGVGSRIPLGGCHRIGTATCEHIWRGFIFDAWNRGVPCSCWVRVGTGPRSLPATTANFLKPWFFIYTKHGRVTSFYFALKFVD